VLERYPYITHLFLNAGVGAWSAIYWPDAFLETLTDPIGALTNPRFKKQEAGWKTEKDGLGWVWQCSVFGHWCIVSLPLEALLAFSAFSPNILESQSQS
jgi:3-keto steroid reductase